MNDINVSNDLRQLSNCQVRAKNYNRYDMNGYRFRTATLEASRPLAATSNSGVVTTAANASGNVDDYYGVLQNIIEYTFEGSKELKVVFFDCTWFDPVHGTRVDDLGMVEIKHTSRYTENDNNIVLAHQVNQVYYLTYPHPSLNAWWVVYKVNPELDPRRYDDYNEEDHIDVYQDEVVEDTFIVSEGEGLAQLGVDIVELMEDEPGPSNQSSRRKLNTLEILQNDLNRQRAAEADSDADDF